MTLSQQNRHYSHFRLLESGVDPDPFIHEIENIKDPWGRTTGRQEKIKVQREAKAIAVRGVRKSAIRDRDRRDVHESRYTSMSKHLPRAVAFLEDTAQKLRGELSRAKIVCLPSGHRVYPHIDRGQYYAVRDRYHLVLQSQPGSWLKTEDEIVEMQVGQLWWFNNKLTHESYNGSDGNRIHFIFDLKPLSDDEERFDG